MGDYRAIADIGDTLIGLLRDNMSDLIAPASVVLLSPADVDDQNTRLTLFLYSVMENPHLRNQEVQNLSSTQLRYPPLSLDLHYLLTTYSSNLIPDRTERTMEEHRILGRAMRIFYDHAILSGTILQGSLAGTDEELRIIANPLSLDDLNKLWSVFPNRSYRPSTGYLVTPVRIESEHVLSTQRVVSKELNHSILTSK